MTLVRYHLPDGSVKETDLKPGNRISSARYALQLDKPKALPCGGMGTCGTCHVRVVSGPFPAPQEAERRTLESLPKVHANSRLGCQLEIPETAETIVVEWQG